MTIPTEDQIAAMAEAFSAALLEGADIHEAMREAARVVEVEGGQLGSAWRRGVMCAVERLDTELAGRVFKYQLADKLAAVRAVLNELDTFCHNTDPDTYQEAFRISEDFNRAARGLPSPPTPTEGEGR